MTFFASGDYELTDSMQVYGEFLLNRRETKVNGYRQFWQYDYAYNYFGYTYTNNPSVIANGFLADALAPGNFIGFSPTAITDHSDTNVTVDYVNAVIGAKGDFVGRRLELGCVLPVLAFGRRLHPGPDLRRRDHAVRLVRCRFLRRSAGHHGSRRRLPSARLVQPAVPGR